MKGMTELEDQNFEEELRSSPYNVKIWLEYILMKSKTASDLETNIIAERALKFLPGSYKLWALHLKNIMAQCENLCPTDSKFVYANNAFERALVFMHKMPLVWKAYLTLLKDQSRIALFGKTLNRALKALPITQHEVPWRVAMAFAHKADFPREFGRKIFERYSQLNPEALEDRVKYLKGAHLFDEAAQVMTKMVNDENFVSKKGKSQENLWNELCALICKNPRAITSIDVDAVIRSAFGKFSLETGKLWVSLADYYLRMLQFEKARDIYEEGLKSVGSARDFEYVFNMYCQYYEISIRSKLEGDGTDNTASKDLKDTKKEEPNKAGDFLKDGNGEGGEFDPMGDDVDLLMARYEALLERRPILLNSVFLRQNPNNVRHWLKRADIYAGRKDTLNVLKTYAMALKTVDPSKTGARGKPHVLWLRLARFYEKNSNDLINVRKTFERAVNYSFQHVDHLATIWCEWVETELRNGNPKEALSVAKQAVKLPYGRTEVGTVRQRVHKSPKLWALYIDLEETLGTFENASSAYDAAIDLGVVTVPLILNYADFLTKNSYFERSFKALERGVEIFKYPHSVPLWERYLSSFLSRFDNDKLDRTRDLFSQAIKAMPKDSEALKKFYLEFAKFEERHGSPRCVMEVYDQMCSVLTGRSQFEAFLLYLKCATKLFGAIRTREVFERALKMVRNDFVPPMCIRFASLEAKFGEVDRARAIYLYGAKFADTRVYKEFWEEFEKFEADYGNIETYSDMNRVKRSVVASFTDIIIPKKITTTKNEKNEMEMTD